MLNKISSQLAELLVRHQVIACTEKEEYIYGYEIQLSRFFLFGFIAVVAAFTGSLLVSTLFMVSFLYIKARIHCYHCQKYRHCFALSASIYLSFLMQYLFATQYATFSAHFILWVLVACCVLPAKLFKNRHCAQSSALARHTQKLLLLILAMVLFALVGLYILPAWLCSPVIYSSFMVIVLHKPYKEGAK